MKEEDLCSVNNFATTQSFVLPKRLCADTKKLLLLAVAPWYRMVNSPKCSDSIK